MLKEFPVSLVSNLRAFLSFSVYRSMWFDPYSVISSALWSRYWGDKYAWERVEMSLPCLILKTVDQIQQVRWAQHYGILGVVTIDNWGHQEPSWKWWCCCWTGEKKSYLRSHNVLGELLMKQQKSVVQSMDVRKGEGQCPYEMKYRELKNGGRERDGK